MTTTIAFNLEQQGRTGTPGQILFEQALIRGFRHFAGDALDSDTDGAEVVHKLMADAEILSSAITANKCEMIFVYGTEMLVRIYWYMHYAEIGWDVIGSDEAAVLTLNRAITELVPPIRHDETNIVPVKYWALNSQGHPEGRTRKVEINPWEKISENYPIDLRTRLQELIDLNRPGTGGKLVLWHGLPGTGKTHFLRSLAYAWREWCDVSYVVDPDMMFERAYYMMNTVLSGEAKDRWHLIVLEDSGEFMLTDAKKRTGQGLSRLLNLTDGLVGQGLKLLVLMTTNEKVFTLHPAVNRPGRCLAEIAFTTFPHKEAVAWAHDHHVALSSSMDDVSLADLYELVSETHIQSNVPLVSTGQYA